MDKFFLVFFGLIFLIFGLGITLSQMIGDKLVSGFWFMGIGFLLLIIRIIFQENVA